MPIINWNDSFLVNVKEIDDQHKKLVDILNKLADSMLAGKGKEALQEIFQELIDYTIFHFDSEEKLLKKHGFADFDKHKKEHEEFKVKVTELKKSFDNGSILISNKVLNFLKDWINNHILKSDKEYSKIFK